MRGRDGREGVLGDAVGLALRRDQSTVREHPRCRGAREPGVRHDGSVGAGDGAGGIAASVRRAMSFTEPAKAPLMPLSASVNSLGMIQSLLEALSAIFGRVSRYW